MIVRENGDILEIEHRPGWIQYVVLLGVLATVLYVLLLARLYDHAKWTGLSGVAVFLFQIWWDRGVKTSIDREQRTVDTWYNGVIWFRWPGWHWQYSFSDIQNLEIRRQTGRYRDTYEVRARLAKTSVPMTYFRLGFRESHELAREISEYVGLTTAVEAIG